MAFKLKFVRRSLKKLQMLHRDGIYFGEVKFYFFKMFGDELRAFALVSQYSPPNEYLLQRSHTALAVCRYRSNEALLVIDAKSILSVVAMVPFPFSLDGHGDQYFTIEKMGLDVFEVDDLEDNE